MELWCRSIKYPYYEISNYGNVRNYNTKRLLKTRFHINRIVFKIHRLDTDKKYIYKIMSVAREVYICFSENGNKLLEHNKHIYYKDGNCYNCNIDNLYSIYDIEKKKLYKKLKWEQSKPINLLSLEKQYKQKEDKLKGKITKLKNQLNNFKPDKIFNFQKELYDLYAIKYVNKLSNHSIIKRFSKYLDLENAKYESLYEIYRQLYSFDYKDKNNIENEFFEFCAKIFFDTTRNLYNKQKQEILFCNYEDTCRVKRLV